MLLCNLNNQRFEEQSFEKTFCELKDLKPFEVRGFEELISPKSASATPYLAFKVKKVPT